LYAVVLFKLLSSYLTQRTALSHSNMKAYTVAPLLAAIGYALPQACQTTTEQVVVPTGTTTYLDNPVVTVTATTPKDLGTFTDVVRVSSTNTLETLTSTETDCAGSHALPTSTVYTTAGASSDGAASPSQYARGLFARQSTDCVVTKYSTTTYGQDYTFASGTETSTYTRYSEYTQATVTATSSGFTAYEIATATTTACPSSAATTTQDARCAPSALISAAGVRDDTTQYGLSYAQLTSSGATYRANTTDASSCCQLCAEADKCAASSWDSRTGACTLAFPVQFDSGELSCGLGLQVYYGAGPNHPMEPGSGLFVAEVCGRVAFANAKPDDGT
jgi:hypothetical protein